jgi:hypothetical protein
MIAYIDRAANPGKRESGKQGFVLESKRREVSMSLKGKLFAAIGAIALGASLVSVAPASAQTSAELTVNVVCPVVGAELSVDGGFADINPFVNSTTSTSPGAIKVKVNTGCYLGPWNVTASATQFFNSETDLPFIPVSSLQIVDGQVTTSVFDGGGILEPPAPSTNNVSFNLLGAGSDPLLETTPLFLGFDAPAPYITEAKYTGKLNMGPGVLAVLAAAGDDQTYESTLTITLALT